MVIKSYLKSYFYRRATQSELILYILRKVLYLWQLYDYS